MQATILSFRRGRHTIRMNQFLLEIPGCESPEKAAPFIGKTVVWKSPARAPGKKPREIRGKITHLHGRNGILRARFPKGLPGEAARSKVRILE